MSNQENIESSQPTWQEIEKSIINILRAGVFYKKDKNKGFMDSYKKQLDELRQSEDPDQYIIDKAIDLLPNEETYNTKINAYKTSYYKDYPRINSAIVNYFRLSYKIAKEHFITENQLEEELNSWINS